MCNEMRTRGRLLRFVPKLLRFVPNQCTKNGNFCASQHDFTATPSVIFISEATKTYRILLSIACLFFVNFDSDGNKLNGDEAGEK